MLRSPRWVPCHSSEGVGKRLSPWTSTTTMPQNIVADEHHSRPRASPARSCLHQSHANSGPLSNSPAPSPNQLLSASSSQSQLVPPPSFYVAVPPLGQRTALLAPGNTAQLFDASSDNTVSDSNIKVAGRDLINLSVSINALLPSHTPGQQASETANQSSYLWPSILSRFWSPFSGTSVTLDPAESPELPRSQGCSGS
ncbi:hypothetical protein BKA70DRAFT_473034 [Coprinopsis sp. MPI-PUGE-AT-0042]|nr:hypothetical protein BKA70DRAFT_473034 [Coprinopsis sp. MPI-PUGE-AT-0042]